MRKTHVTQTQVETQISKKLDRILACVRNIELILVRLAQEVGDNHYAVQYIASSVGLIKSEVEEIKKIMGVKE